jgi:hypothetical protein
MTQRGQPTTLQERFEIKDRAEAGQSDPEIARGIGRPLPTVRKWRRRGQRQGRAGLASKMGRPARGALSTFSASLRDTTCQMREAHPGWGPKTILVRLEKLDEFQGQPLPDRSSIARYLYQEELTRPYERHSELPQPPLSSAQAPHDEWEVDAQGPAYVPRVGAISLINLCDVYSKVKLASYACLVGKRRATGKPTTEDYQLVFRLAFLRWGRPKRIASDRDSAFYDNTTPSPYPTRLHLWLIGLGIDLAFGRPGRPTDQATDERFHQTISAQGIQGHTFETWEALQDTLNERLDFLNWELPCRTLGNQPPLLAHPEAVFSGRLYHPELEAELFDLQRVYNYLASGRWFRRVTSVGQVSLGSHRYGLGSAWAKQTVEITFDPTDQHFIFRSEDGSQVQRLPAQGLSKEVLMGELEPLVTLPAYQLALPFSLQEWRVIRLCETL